MQSPKLFLCVNLRFENANVGQIAVQFGVIEAVADHEFVGDVEAQVVDAERHRGVAPGRFVEEGADAHAGRLALAELGVQVGQGQAAVDDVFDDDDVLAGDVHIEVFEQSDHTTGMGAAAVA